MLGWRAASYPGIAIAISVTILTTVGPNLQYYSFSALSKDAPNIYSSAYQDGYVQWPSLWNWYFVTSNWIFVSIGIICTLYCLKRTRIIDVSISLWICISTCLTILDLALWTISANHSVDFLLECVISNVIGGGAAASILFASLGFTTSLKNNNINSNLALLNSLIICSISTLCSISLYYVFFFFYQPLSVDLDLVYRSPLAGYATVSDKPFKSDSTEADRADFKKFSWLPAEGLAGSISTSGSSKDLRLHWTPTTGRRSFELSIAIFLDCVIPDPAKLRRIARLTSLDANKSLSIQFDPKGADLETESLTLVGLPMKNKEISMFWLSDGPKLNTFRLTDFASKSRAVWAEANGPLNIAVTAPLLDLAAKTKKVSPRTLTIVNGTERRTIRFIPKARIMAKHIGTCTSIPNLRTVLRDKHDLSYEVEGIGVTVLLSLKEIDGQNIEISREKAGIKIEGIDGWLSLKDIEKEDLSDVSIGSTSTLGLYGSVSELMLDGSSYPVRPIDNIVAIGDFDGRFINSGQVRFSGRAVQVWKNQRRVNLTRWERTSTEYQLALVGALITVVFAFIRIAWPVAWDLRKEEIL